MPQLRANNLVLEVESFGRLDAPAIVLVMGLGAPLTRWNIELCDALVARGYRVIRFDNRDCGLSTRLDRLPVPSFGKAGPNAAPYSIADMAADTLGLLDALAIDAAHFVGASLGGAVVQHIAAEAPRRTLSLTSIMASTGNPLLPPPTPLAAAALMAPLPLLRDEDSIVADAIQRFRAVASPAYPAPDADLDRVFRSEYRRGFHPPGVARQLAALVADGDRRPLLARIAAPTVVLHGADDPLIRIEHGRDTAAHIRGAELRVIAGMGHDFPVALSTTFAEAICAAAGRP